MLVQSSDELLGQTCPKCNGAMLPTKNRGVGFIPSLQCVMCSYNEAIPEEFHEMLAEYYKKLNDIQDDYEGTRYYLNNKMAQEMYSARVWLGEEFDKAMGNSAAEC